MSRRTKPVWQKSLARERIEQLFAQAEENIKEHPERSHRYVEMALNVSTRYRKRIPREMKRSVCKHCHHYIKNGVNSRTRLNQKGTPKVVVTCLDCNGIMRYPYLKEKQHKEK